MIPLPLGVHCMHDFSHLSESTLVPISFVIVLISGIAWALNLKSNVDSNTETTSRVEKLQLEYNKTVLRIDERLSRMEGKLYKMPDSLDK